MVFPLPSSETDIIGTFAWMLTCVFNLISVALQLRGRKTNLIKCVLLNLSSQGEELGKLQIEICCRKGSLILTHNSWGLCEEDMGNLCGVIALVMIISLCFEVSGIRQSSVDKQTSVCYFCYLNFRGRYVTFICSMHLQQRRHFRI